MQILTRVFAVLAFNINTLLTPFKFTVRIIHLYRRLNTVRSNRTRMQKQNGGMSETTSWGRLCCQNPSHAYSTPSKLSAILCVLLGNPLRAVSQKSRFFLVQRNFPIYTRGLLGCLLGFWPSGPKPCGGNYYYYFPCPGKFLF